MIQPTLEAEKAHLAGLLETIRRCVFLGRCVFLEASVWKNELPFCRRLG